VTSLLFGLIYLGQVTDQKGVMNINGALFLLLQQSSFGSVFPVTNVSHYFSFMFNVIGFMGVYISLVSLYFLIKSLRLFSLKTIYI